MGLHYGLSSHLHPYYMFASSEGIERITDQPASEQTEQRLYRGFNATLSYLAFMKFFRRVKKHVSISAIILFFKIF